MADPRAFVSFDFDHNETAKILFVGQSKNSRTPFSIQDWSAKSSMPQSQWEKLVKAKVNNCNMLIVLVGKTMASATGVAKEVTMARDQNVPVFGVYVGGANSTSNLPSGLARNRTIQWDWNGIAAEVTKMMGEWKAWSSRRLREKGLMPAGRPVWTRHGSTRYLWNEREFAPAVEYVLEGQDVVRFKVAQG